MIFGRGQGRNRGRRLEQEAVKGLDVGYGQAGTTPDSAYSKQGSSPPITVQTIPTLVPKSGKGQKVMRSDLSKDQKAVYEEILAWAKARRKGEHLSLGGLAGTGKSTLVSVLVNELKDWVVATCAYTGKAAYVLNQKLRAAGCSPRRSITDPSDPGARVDPGIVSSTIHSLIYIPETDKKTGKVLGWKRKPDLPADLIIVDEASMIGTEMWNDLRSYGVPILAVGDHGQLPPVGSAMMNLMENPMLRLEKIHRQAEDNPIIRLAHHVRSGGRVSDFDAEDDPRIVTVPGINPVIEEFTNSLDNAILCGYNRTRVMYNGVVRRHRGLEGPYPDPGDVVICLKNVRPIFNGMRGIVHEVDYANRDDPFCRFPMAVNFPFDGIRVRGKAQSAQFNMEKPIAEFREVTVLPGLHGVVVRTWEDVGLLYDYGYAMTVHKAQGSQFGKVALAMEPIGRSAEDQIRWSYTGITRASEQLYLLER